MNIIIFGANGNMGRAVAHYCNTQNINILQKIDTDTPLPNTHPKICPKTCIIDFSNHSALDNLLEFALRLSLPTVIATTGHTKEQLKAITEASSHIPIFLSANLSLGVAILHQLISTTAKALKNFETNPNGFDIEIIEKHHNQKLDSPSGTSLALAKTLTSIYPNKPLVYGREQKLQKRENEIALHAIRGGNIIGDHDVLFIGKNESITISHKAHCKSLFAMGAIKAAQFITNKTHGLYNNLLSE
ncbi:MAG: 4-hydroxy-tetrahydrodipicolinate reductase [Firmicutes bacterium]|nr:4-hydroxy-tetrahydrodipicolinate reductase [Bacillota bacterium]